MIRRYRYDSGGRAGFTLFLSLLALSICVWPQQAKPADSLVEGEVVKIADGDTLTLLTLEKEQVKVRLAEIDTPEKGQPYYQKAKQALADRVFRQNIQVEIVDWDRYGRAVGKIILDGENVNAWMVAEGHAWVYRQYSKKPCTFGFGSCCQGIRFGPLGLASSRTHSPVGMAAGSQKHFRSINTGSTRPEVQDQGQHKQQRRSHLSRTG